MNRPYRKTRRAEAEEATRRRIVDATMQLHETLGPRATTISAIAEKAGVQRLTVYRHFPDDAALFRACSSGWIERHPPPTPMDWSSIDDPIERARTGLTSLYAYYGRTRGMWSSVFRDESVVPAIAGPVAEFRAYLNGVAAALASGFVPAGAELRTTLGHAVAFPTWDDLDRRGLGPEAAASLVLRWIEASREQAG